MSFYQPLAPGGASSQIQFNASGGFGGSPNLIWDGVNLTSSGLMPDSAGIRDIGSDLTRWANIYADNLYSGDLHLKNDRGDYTLIEEEDALTIRNNKTGKVYNIVMTEREV